MQPLLSSLSPIPAASKSFETAIRIAVGEGGVAVSSCPAMSR